MLKHNLRRINGKYFLRLFFILQAVGECDEKIPTMQQLM